MCRLDAGCAGLTPSPVVEFYSTKESYAVGLRTSHGSRMRVCSLAATAQADGRNEVDAYTGTGAIVGGGIIT